MNHFSLFKRHPEFFIALALAVLAMGLYLPFLGSYPLWDPWEPHYTQVAWEMQNHNTWMNPFYRHNDHWWSKPPLHLWFIRLGMLLFWDQATDFANHEFAARFFIALFSALMIPFHYLWVRKLFGRATAVMASLVLITAPQYFFIARQVMVDGPFVASFAAGFGLLLVPWFTKMETPQYVKLRNKQQGTLFANLKTNIIEFVWNDRRFYIGSFWALQAISTLAKGFLPPFLIVIILAVYTILTFEFSDTPFKQIPRSFGKHILNQLKKMELGWGMLIYLLIAAPWYIYMTVKHGYPFWNEFIFYHHLGRVAGTIEKPGGTFDVFIRQISFALFPWSGFAFAGLFFLVPHCDPHGSQQHKRNLVVFLAAFVPFMFFALSGTKFNHYIFPVIPFLAVCAAIVLNGFLQNSQQSTPSWDNKALYKLFIAISIMWFSMFARDLFMDFRHLLRLFIYYYNRPGPSDFRPHFILQGFFFIPLGIVMAVALFQKFLTKKVVAAFSILAIGFTAYGGWVIMPSMKYTYSFKSLYESYLDLAKPGEPVADFIDWNQPRRSVIFLFQNRARHLKKERDITRYFRRPGRKFIIVDKKRLTQLRDLVKSLDQKLYVVADNHPYARLVSNEKGEKQILRISDYLHQTVPTDIHGLNATFEDSISLLGYKVQPEIATAGSKVQITFYYRCDKLMKKNWQIFIHGDAPGAPRIHGDHYPVKGLYTTDEWQVGDIIEDTFTIRIPSNYSQPFFIVWTGFYEHNSRLKVTSEKDTDGDNRIRGPQIKVARP